MLGGLATVQGALAGLRDGVNAFAGAMQSSLGVANAMLAGYVRQGISASYIGQQLTLQTQRLSATLAGLFRPELEKVVDTLRNLVNWLNRLSDEQRRHIAYWLEAGAATLTVATLLPRVVGMIQGVVGAVRALTAAMLAFDVATGGILPIIGAIVAGILALGAGSEIAEGGFGKLFKTLQPVLEALGRLWESLSVSLEPIIEGLASIFEALVPIIATVIDFIAVALKPLGAVLQVVGAVMKIIADLIAGTTKLLQPLIDMFMKLARVLTDNVVPALNGTSVILTGMGEKIAQVTGNAKGGAIGGSVRDAANRGPLSRPVGGMESIEAQYNRLAVAALNASAGMKSPAEKQVDELEKANKNLGAIHSAITGIKPAVVR